MIANETLGYFIARIQMFLIMVRTFVLGHFCHSRSLAIFNLIEGN